ncbi:TFIIB-type zinc ribbon-containing protein [Mycolicibacterium sp. 050232]|uniref:TFIIB-type zinc ribbon-containing protein n=1 Tax=Mycolicibacterium sp. 050232 TaxID=3113982 RepID=UPI003FA60F82
MLPRGNGRTSQALHSRVGRYGDMSIPPYEPPKPPASPGVGNTLLCPKCAGVMKTYERNGIHLEQCDTCRGIFLDFGELEALTQLENRFVQAPPPPAQAHPGYHQGYSDYGPGWGHRGNKHYRKQGFGRLFFSS